MKIEIIHYIRERGTVYNVTVDVNTRIEGTRVRRIRDGMTWHIRGFERFALIADDPILTAGERVGLLLDECDLVVGDDVAFVQAEEVPHGIYVQCPHAASFDSLPPHCARCGAEDPWSQRGSNVDTWRSDK